MKYRYPFLAIFGLLLCFATSGQAAGEPEAQFSQADALLSSPSLDFPKAQQALALYEGMLEGPPPIRPAWPGPASF